MLTSPEIATLPHCPATLPYCNTMGSVLLRTKLFQDLSPPSIVRRKSMHLTASVFFPPFRGSSGSCSNSLPQIFTQPETVCFCMAHSQYMLATPSFFETPTAKPEELRTLQSSEPARLSFQSLETKWFKASRIFKNV